jgi:hypothetical protein
MSGFNLNDGTSARDLAEKLASKQEKKAVTPASERELLELSEELFRVSLKSKNEELVKLEAEKDSAQLALVAEVKRSGQLNDMLSDALEELRRKQADLDCKEDFIAGQEEMTRALGQRLEKVILQPPGDDIGVWTQGEAALCGAMQERIAALEKQVTAQTVQVTVLRALLEREIASRDAAREATIQEFTSLQKQHSASQQMLSVALSRIKCVRRAAVACVCVQAAVVCVFVHEISFFPARDLAFDLRR